MNKDEYQKLENEYHELHGYGISYRSSEKDIWILMRYQQELLENVLAVLEDLHFYLHQPKDEKE